MKEFKVGDKVFDIREGWGKITEIDNCSFYPIEACFNNSKGTYTIDGRWNKNGNISLSHNEYSINSQIFPREMLVKGFGHYKWQKRLVLFINPENNRAYAVYNRNELKSLKGIQIGYWEFYKEIEEEEESVVELTIQDISEGKGVGVDPKLIRVKQ